MRQWKQNLDMIDHIQIMTSVNVERSTSIYTDILSPGSCTITVL